MCGFWFLFRCCDRAVPWVVVSLVRCVMATRGCNGRGQIDPEPDAWGAWADSYREALLHYARLAETLGVVSALGVDEETAADAATALASLVSTAALQDHFEDKYYVALKEVAEKISVAEK